ncbi:IclR family transcriptional regulator [Streptomyces violaceusniger]|uniref:IclR family transcriptional regulator n=1 Tax=Streptomyces violaceusniger TaxID=68280 RepID=UPI0009C1CC1F|nr:IclR family transcriptional regulator [Streptomyces hygroscopicus]AQW46605.1 IclR family transcriptional regulator [Streptomyces hygroscopicus]
MEGPRREHLQSVVRAVSVLDCFGPDTPVLGLTELAQRLGLGKTVVFRITQTLVSTGLLEREHNGRYRIGLRAFEIGSQYQLHRALEEAARGPMRELAARRSHIVYLGTLRGRYVTYLSIVEGTGPIQIRATPGTRAGAHATALGTVLLSHLPEREVRDLLSRDPLERLSRNTVTDIDMILPRLARARESGYAINNGEHYEAIGSVAAPVFGPSGRPVAAVSNGFPIGLVSASELHEMTREVVDCAARISSTFVRQGGAPPVRKAL